MEKESNSLPETKPNKWIWITLAVFVACAALGSCIFMGIAGVFILRSSGNIIRAEPVTESFPSVQTMPVVPSAPTKPAILETLPVLDEKAEPLYGSAILQRGFTPDPHIVPVLAGGRVDTSDFDLYCGFTSPAPSFVLTLRGGASAGFLRIYFASDGDTDTTLIVHTPNQGWSCVDDSTFGKDPVIDIEFADSGDYAIWVGAWQSNTNETGSLYITQSEEVTP